MAIAYETVLVFSMKNGEEAAKALAEKFKDMIAASGTVKEVDEWGKRRLAYDINYESEGYYIVVTFTGAPSFPAELDRIVKITDGALRVMVTVK